MPAKAYLAGISAGWVERYATKAEYGATGAEHYAIATGTLCHRRKLQGKLLLAFGAVLNTPRTNDF